MRLLGLHHGRPRGTSQLHVNSTKKRGAPVYLSGDSQPTLTSLSSPEHMTGDENSSEDEEYITPSALTARGSTPVDSPPSILLRQWRMTGSQLHLNLSLIYPVLLNPYHLIRHSIRWTLNMNKNMRVMKKVNQIVTLTLKDLCQQPQGEVPGVQKAYLQCTMDRYKYTAQ